MAKLRQIKIKYYAINVIKSRFPDISERTIYTYLAGGDDTRLMSESRRQRIAKVRQFALQFERK